MNQIRFECILGRAFCTLLGSKLAQIRIAGIRPSQALAWVDKANEILLPAPSPFQQNLLAPQRGGAVMDRKRPRLLFFNGQNIPYENARVHVLSTAFKYAATVYEGNIIGPVER